MIKMITLSISFLLAFADNAFAHHPLGGVVPETMVHGLLSGLGHPVMALTTLPLFLLLVFSNVSVAPACNTVWVCSWHVHWHISYLGGG